MSPDPTTEPAVGADTDADTDADADQAADPDGGGGVDAVTGGQRGGPRAGGRRRRVVVIAGQTTGRQQAGDDLDRRLRRCPQIVHAGTVAGIDAETCAVGRLDAVIVALDASGLVTASTVRGEVGDGVLVVNLAGGGVVVLPGCPAPESAPTATGFVEAGRERPGARVVTPVCATVQIAAPILRALAEHGQLQAATVATTAAPSLAPTEVALGVLAGAPVTLLALAQHTPVPLRLRVTADLDHAPGVGRVRDTVTRAAQALRTVAPGLTVHRCAVSAVAGNRVAVEVEVAAVGAGLDRADAGVEILHNAAVALAATGAPARGQRRRRPAGDGAGAR